MPGEGIKEMSGPPTFRSIRTTGTNAGSPTGRRAAAAMFANGTSAPQVAAVLEVSTKAAYQWRRTWVAGGVEALGSKGRPGPPRRLNAAQVKRLEAKTGCRSGCGRLRRGPAVDAGPGGGADRCHVPPEAQPAGRVGATAPYGLEPAAAGAPGGRA